MSESWPACNQGLVSHKTTSRGVCFCFQALRVNPNSTLLIGMYACVIATLVVGLR